MDFELPEPIRVESEIGDRLILVRPVGGSQEFVTIDFEWRRWQLGNHPDRVLNFPTTLYKSRNWKMRMVEDAIHALLAVEHEEPLEESRPPMDENPSLGQQPYLFTEEPPAEAEPGPEPITTATLPDPLPAGPPPGATSTYAWKRLVDGQISQDINARTPEALFELAGFRPYLVFDPIQGYLCVPVRWSDGRWEEIKGTA